MISRLHAKRVLVITVAALFCGAAFAENAAEVSVTPLGSTKPVAVVNKGKYPAKEDIFSIKPARSPFLDTKQAVYQYDPNASYPVVSRAGQNTQIDIPEGLLVTGFYLSDVNEENWAWHVSPDKKHIFIQPLQSGLFNSASITTSDSHTFLLAVTSEEEGQWFQRVKWVLPKKFQVTGTKSASVEATAVKANGRYYENYTTDTVKTETIKGIDANTLNTKWKIEGEAPFKPLSVYNDEDFTWLELPPKMPEMPLLFALSPEGQPELVNYTLTESGRYKVNKVLQGALLKIGKQEVRLTNLRGWKAGNTNAEPKGKVLGLF